MFKGFVFAIIFVIIIFATKYLLIKKINKQLSFLLPMKKKDFLNLLESKDDVLGIFVPLLNKGIFISLNGYTKFFQGGFGFYVLKKYMFFIYSDFLMIYEILKDYESRNQKGIIIEGSNADVVVDEKKNEWLCKKNGICYLIKPVIKFNLNKLKIYTKIQGNTFKIKSEENLREIL